MIWGVLVMLAIRMLSSGVAAQDTKSLESSALLESRQRADSPKIDVTAPSVTNRVTAGVAVVPKQQRPGEPVTVFLRLRIAPGCHIYGFEQSKGSAVSTSIEIGKPNLLVPIDEWHCPKLKVQGDGTRAFSGDLLFHRRFRIHEQLRKGIVNVPIEISYQVCNEAVCWPPEKKQLECLLEIIE